MQSSPARGMVPNGHIHPDPSGLHIYQDSMAGMQFDSPEMEAQTRALVEQAQLDETGRDAKMAAQRQLGLQQTSYQPTFLAQSHPTPGAQLRPGPIPISQTNGHPMAPPNGMAVGQYYMDAQGRHVPIVPFPQYPRPSQHPNMAQAPFQNMSPAQQQALLHHHFVQQSQMQQPQQMQQRQQAQFQYQQQLGRMAQTPPRPAPMLPANHQSPVGVRSQPASVNRSISRVGSTNPSPGPTTRGKSQPAQRVAQLAVESTSVGISAPTPVNGILKAPTPPDQTDSNQMPTGQTSTAQLHPNDPPDAFLPPAMRGPNYNHARRETHMSLFVEARKKEEKVNHLQRLIEDAQTQLQTMIKGEVIAQEVAKTRPPLEEMRERFDKHVLEFLKKAGYEEAATGLQHVMSVRYELEGGATQSGGSQAPSSHSGAEPIQVERPGSKTSSPKKGRHNKTPTRSPGANLALSASHPALNESMMDGRNDASSSHTNGAGSSRIAAPAASHEMVVSPIASDNPVPDPFIAQVKQESSSPLKRRRQAPEEPLDDDLGYLYSWWSVFEETQRLLEAKRLDYSIDLHALCNVPFSAMPPTSALATQIAVSAPAAAVRATSVDAGRTASRMGFAPMTAISSGHAETATEQDDSVNAKLRAAEAMRVAQQAHIDAQNEDKRRQSVADLGMIAAQNNGNIPPNQPQTFILPNGQTVHMTSEQLQQHLLAQAGQAAQQKQNSFPIALMQPHFHPGSSSGSPDNQQPTPERGRPTNGVIRQPHHSEGSPLNDSGRSNKRGADPGSGDVHSKRAKVSNKRPTPEEHQRQALEIASRVAGIHSPSSAMLGHIPQPNTGHPGGPPPNMHDPQRRYPQAAAQYAQSQILASPATGFPMSPAHGSSPLDHMHQSPGAPFDMSAHLGMNGLGGPPHSAASASFRRPPGLDMDGLGGDNEVDRPPHSAASSTKRKTTGKKPGPKAGTKKKPAKLKQQQSSSDGEQEAMASAPPTAEQQSPPLGWAFQMNGPPGGMTTAQSRMFPPVGPAEDMRFDSSQFDQGQSYGHHPPGSIPHPPQTATMHQISSGQSGPAANGHNASTSPNMGNNKNGPPPADHEDDIFKAFEGMTGGDQPLSGANEHFNSFDFDWGSANFGGEDQDWSGVPDTAVPDNMEE